MSFTLYPLPRIPVSTYRLQFNQHFTFTDAKEIIPYLHELGITDVYCSPYLKAKKGSLHGYDIVDHNTLNPEIGTEEEHHDFIRTLREYGIGQIYDIVPNHMEIASNGNSWWMDVLENGMSSLYVNYFDIDWNPITRELTNKILLPILGDQYGNVLDNQELLLTFEEGAFYINYYEHTFPIRPQTYLHILRHRLHELEEILSDEDPHLIELLSIITALDHLPLYTDVDSEKVKERHREKEVIKKRLMNLYGQSEDIRVFIDKNVHIFNGEKKNTQSFDLLDNLLDEQIYRLSYWRVATEEINYRRFFDISNLAAIRVENPHVFRETHALVFQFINEKNITGLRVDHPDGLYNPSEYFQRLQQDCFVHMQLGNRERTETTPPCLTEQSGRESEFVKQYQEKFLSDPQYKPFYIIGEKILTLAEKMPENWPIYSTTGYDFLNSLNGIFVETKNEKSFDKMYARFIKSKPNFNDIVYEKKKLIMQVSMSSEINTLGRYLKRISVKNRHTRDFTLNSLTDAIIEIIAFFPVYRTYITSSGINDRDRRYIELAVSKARRKNPALSESIFSFLRDVLLNNYPNYFDDEDKQEWLDIVMRFQQITGPVMAKGVEDTAFYVFNRLVSLNEVGGSPERFGTPLETFHGQNMERIKSWPHALLATSTHDTKRSEDVRARINVLSEIPEKWKDCLAKWSRYNRKKKSVFDDQTVPDRNEEYLFYQTLIGAWPIGIKDISAYEEFIGRIKEYMVKALREAKVNTSWINPNTSYEEALFCFIDAALTNTPNNVFLKDFKIFQEIICHYGMYNSLSQTLLKITSPGIPDFYQGTELWDLSLVDPDNRRPVDYETRISLLNDLKTRETEMTKPELARKLTESKEDGNIKLYTMYKALNCRREKRRVFENGDYIPLEAAGEKNNNVCAFARVEDDTVILVIVIRYLTKLLDHPESLPFGKTVWNNSHILIPFDNGMGDYKNIFTDETVSAKKYNDTISIPLSEIFANFPVALMEKIH